MQDKDAVAGGIGRALDISDIVHDYRGIGTVRTDCKVYGKQQRNYREEKNTAWDYEINLSCTPAANEFEGKKKYQGGT